MRYINYYYNDTLSIFDKNTNKILANILLDKEDIPKVQKLHWRLNEKGYVIASTKKHKTIKLHNFILERDTSNQKITCDHINRNKLDNRKENLRIISHLENNLNTDRIQKGKGYCFRKDRNKWMAYIGINYKLKTIGYFNTEKEAKEARKYYCENQ